MLGIENACVIVAEPTPKSKIDKILFFGAEVVLMEYVQAKGMTNIDAYYDDPKSTVAKEPSP